MVADHFGHYTDSLRQILLTFTQPMTQIATLPAKFSRWLSEEGKENRRILAENKKLQTENLLLKAQILELEHFRQESVRLEKLLGTSAGFGQHDIKIANVIFYNNDPLAQFLEIDKGQLAGLSTHQPVIDAYGILGQITTVTPLSSRVLLVTDPDHQMPVRLRRTAQRGLLTGIGHDKLRLDFIPKTSSIKMGDLIESTGLGQVFPAGYPVAEVEKIRALPESPYLEIIAKPTAQISLSYKVLVLSSKQASPANPLEVPHVAH